MPVTLKLTFPAGRYHATPWGRHVNEGVPEWPPSPWRLLRALVATWKRKCPQVPEEAVRAVLEKLAGPPCFRLPPARVAHTRHYVPWEKKGPQDRTLVFDTFVSVKRSDPLLVGWPDVTLTEEEEGVLRQLLGNLTTLGRAEGWVTAEWTDGPVEWNCRPAAATAGEGELVAVLCADPASAFESTHYPAHDEKKLRRGLAAGEHLFDCPRWHLCLDTETIHKERWGGVPGALWVSYCRRLDALSAAPRAADRPAGRALPTVARFALDGAVLPLVTETVAVAEAFRTDLLRCFARVVRRRHKLPEGATPKTYAALRSRTLSGKEGGEMIQGSHAHAYYLPSDEDGDGRIDHVTVVASAGFLPDEVAALDGLRHVRLEEELRLLLVGLGQPGDFRSRLFGPARVWESATPFVVTRHVKTRGQKKDPPECRGMEGREAFARRVLAEELGRWARRQPVPVEVTRVEGVGQVRTGSGGTRVLAYRRSRGRREGDDGERRAAGAYRVEFAGPVCGPLCVGHAAHFGLGLFLAEQEGR